MNGSSLHSMFLNSQLTCPRGAVCTWTPSVHLMHCSSRNAKVRFSVGNSTSRADPFRSMRDSAAPAHPGSCCRHRGDALSETEAGQRVRSAAQRRPSAGASVARHHRTSRPERHASDRAVPVLAETPPSEVFPDPFHFGFALIVPSVAFLKRGFLSGNRYFFFFQMKSRVFRSLAPTAVQALGTDSPASQSSH